MTSVIEEWQPYLDARSTGIKQRWKPLLEQRIAALAALDADEKRHYVDQLCQAYFDECHDAIPIQHPAIWRHVLQRLAEGIRDESSGHLIWAFRASSSDGVWEVLPDYAKTESPRALLKKVLAIDPNEASAQRLLFLDYLDALDFAQHELPDYLCVDEEVCSTMIRDCEALLASSPELAKIKTRFGGDFERYRAVHVGWIEFRKQGLDVDFFAWLENRPGYARLHSTPLTKTIAASAQGSQPVLGQSTARRTRKDTSSEM